MNGVKREPITLSRATDERKLRAVIDAVIYTRVSTKGQTENLSLPTQLKTCEEYCERQGLEVIASFREEGESAKTADRTQLQKLLTFCRANKGRVQFVVVYNLTRFAREKYDHFALRAHLKSLGISLRSATEPIDDTSTGKLMEGVLAAFAQFDNDVRSERTRGGMRAALELGRWPFLAPLGYLNARGAAGKNLMPDPERAPLIRRAFQDFATGRFTKDEVLQNVNTLGLTTRRGKAVPSQTFDAILRNPVYISQIQVAAFGISKRGEFEPLITEKIFFRVQGILDGRYELTAPRGRNDPDFPLRGYVRCTACGKTLTASWSKGRSDYYAYYHCRNGCRAVNVAKTKLEDLFVQELARLQPTAGFMRLVKDRVLTAWRELKRGRAATDRRDRTQAENDSGEAEPFGRGVPLRALDRYRDVRPPRRQTAPRTHARADRAALLGAR